MPVDKETQEAFFKEYGELVKKYEADFVSFPLWQPDGAGGWKMILQNQLVSTKETGVKSPFVADA